MKEFIIENLLAGSTVSFFDVAIKLFMALVIGVTIYIAYYFTSSKVSYNSNFNLSLVAMAIITTAIMAVITNNIADGSTLYIEEFCNACLLAFGWHNYRNV